jgi:hypothetical protein
MCVFVYVCVCDFGLCGGGVQVSMVPHPQLFRHVLFVFCFVRLYFFVVVLNYKEEIGVVVVVVVVAVVVSVQASMVW